MDPHTQGNHSQWPIWNEECGQTVHTFYIPYLDTCKFHALNRFYPSWTKMASNMNDTTQSRNLSKNAACDWFYSHIACISRWPFHSPETRDSMGRGRVRNRLGPISLATSPLARAFLHKTAGFTRQLTQFTHLTGENIRWVVITVQALFHRKFFFDCSTISVFTIKGYKIKYA